MNLANFDGIFPNATFTRASTAFLSDGTSVASGVPRYVDGKFGKGIWVEEGTTNKIETEGGASQDWSKWSHYSSSTYWAQPTTQYDDPVMGKVFQGTAMSTAYLYDYNSYALISGIVYTLGVWLKADREITKSLSIYAITNNGGTRTIANATKTVTLNTSWQFISASITPSESTTTAQGGIGVNFQSGNDGVVYYAARPQLEQKAYATSFTAGTRSAETLTIPTTGLSPTQGTFEAWVYVNSMAKRQVANQWNRIFLLPRIGNSFQGIALWHSPSSSNWTLETYNDLGIASSVSAVDTLTPDGWNHFAVKWSATEAKIFINGVPRGTIANPKLPSVFDSNLSIGSAFANTNSYLNTWVDEIRISTIARTDAEILASYNATSKHIPDNYTQALLHFDNNLLSHEEVKAVLMPNGNLHIRGTKQIG